MSKADTISIEGQQYDTATGLPVSAAVTAVESSSTTIRVKTTATPAVSLHGAPQRSSTLRRKIVKKPTAAKHAISVRTQPKHMDISQPRHTAVNRFAPHPAGALHAAPKPRTVDIAPVAHPHVAKAHAHTAAKHQPLTHAMTAKDINAHTVKKAVQTAHKGPTPKRSLMPRQRMVAVLSAVLAVVILGGYVTYLNMPVLSVRVAAAQAGIDASYPNYRPDGYALNGPVIYSEGKVAMNFKANGGNHTFTIAESKSGWDSEALLDNYVSAKAGNDYVPYTERGLTIYTYGNNAAWVNGGILYTVEGDAPLSNSQMRRIATSLL